VALGGFYRQRGERAVAWAVRVANGRARAGITSLAHGDVALVASARGGSRGDGRQSRLMAGDARRRAIMALPAWRARAARVLARERLWWRLGPKRGGSTG
jgi:hypothetical protein